MIDTIYSVTALDRKDDEMRIFINREICIEYLVKNWSDDANFWEYYIEDFEDWCIDHNLNETLEINSVICGDYMRYMLNKNIHYFDYDELFEVNCFDRCGQGTFCKIS